MLAFAAAAGALVILASVASVLCLALGAYLAAPRRSDAETAPPHEEAVAPPSMPDATKALLDSLDDPIVVFDETGKVLFANSASRALVGSDSERKHISAVLRYPEILEGTTRVLAGGAAETIFFSVIVPVERHYRARIARLVSEGPGLVILQFSDLTAMRRAEVLRADFVANASHELTDAACRGIGFYRYPTGPCERRCRRT